MRRLKIAVAVLLTLVAALTVAAYTAINNLELSSYREAIERRLHAATGRQVYIAGRMRLDFGLQPAITVEDVRIANPRWAIAEAFVTVERVAFKIALLPLITGDVRVTSLTLREPVVNLERGIDGKATWRLDPTGNASESGDVPTVRDVRIRNGRIVLYNAASSPVVAKIRNASLRAKDLKALRANGVDESREHGRGLHVQASGTIRGVPLTIRGDFETPERFIERTDVSLPLDVGAKIGGMIAGAKGRVAWRQGDMVPELHVRLKADSVARLHDAFPKHIPPLGPFSVEADVSAASPGYRMTNIDAVLEDSDLSGTVHLAPGPRVQAKLKAATLDVPSLTNQFAGPGHKPTNSGRLFTQRKLPLGLVRKVDGQIQMRVGTLRAAPGIKLDSVSTTASLDGDTLRIQDFTGSLNGAEVGLDGGVDAGTEPPRASLNVQTGQVPYGRLLAAAGVTDMVRGTARLEASLRARGASPRALAETVAGKLAVTGRKGHVDSALLRTASAGVADVLAPWRERGDDLRLRCAVGRFSADAGTLTANALLADTEAATLTGSGTISLAEERYDLRLTPKAKRASLMSLAVPMRLTGPLTDPDLGPDPLGAAKAGAIAVGSVLNPLATAAVLAVRSETTADNPCVAALDKARAAAEQSGDNGGGFFRNLGDRIDETLGTQGDDAQQDDAPVLRDGGR